MLNYRQMIAHITQRMPTWLASQEQSIAQCTMLLRRLKSDRSLQQIVQQRCLNNNIATWHQEDLAGQQLAVPSQQPYRIVGIDGSQIFADHHTGSSWYLINIGSCTLDYQPSTSSLTVESIPFVYTASICQRDELVSQQRTEHEIAYGTDRASSDPSLLTLFDGIALHQHCQTTFLQKAYDRWQQHRSCIASYICQPQTTHLFTLCQIIAQLLQQPFDTNNPLSDTLLLPLLLEAGEYTTPWHTGDRSIAWSYILSPQGATRIECPRYLVEDQLQYQALIKAIYDQIRIGRGYPLCLAEAHLQAVVRERDRQIFYQTIQHAANHYGATVTPSTKLVNKRSISV